MLISEYLNYIKHEKRYSSHTVTASETDLRQFQNFLGEIGEGQLQSVGQMEIRSWIASLAENGISNRSIHRKISSLRSFYKYIIRQGHIKSSPVQHIIPPKVGARLPQFVEEENILELLISSELFDDDYEGRRDEIMIKLFYYTGMRLSELINIKSSDLDVHNSTIKVLGKRNKERLIPISKKFVEEIRNFEVRKEELSEELQKDTYLLLTKSGKKLYPKLVYRRVNAYLSKVTTLSKKSPHILRHTFATHMLNNGADLIAIKEILGHSDLSATQVYTHNSIEKLKNVHEQAHPKG